MKYLLSFLTVCILFVACKKEPIEPDTSTDTEDIVLNDDDSDTVGQDGPSTTNVSVSFRHKVDDQVVSLNNMKYYNADSTNFNVEVLKYFVSNLTFYGLDYTIKLDTAFYIDIDDNSTFTLSYDQPLVNDTYTKIGFTFGLDTGMNKMGLYTNAPEMNMEWPMMMGGGYHYMKLEGKYDSAGTTKNYKIHTGATAGIPGDFEVEFNLEDITEFEVITADGEDIDIIIDMDINKWMSSPHTIVLDSIDGGMMGDTTAQRLVKENGHDVFSIGKID